MVETEIEDFEDNKIVNIVVEEVLKAEEEKLHMENPRGITEDIQKIIENIIKS